MRLTCKESPASTSVVRFPGERLSAPTLRLRRELQPDYVEVQLVAQSLVRTEDLSTFDQADAAMAERIAQLPADLAQVQRDLLLATLLNESLQKAAATCRWFATRRASAHRLGEIAMREIGLRGDGGRALDIAVAEANETSHALVDAWEACERAFGAARAIEIARRGEMWLPEDRSDILWLLKAKDADNVRRRQGV